ncbi:hypothetical protein [Labrenzia sp. OB1]|uniref:hypothetical protein n=1 Tax=Labrenzia sp. OB1 TaxID=1561204 RepID=UPI0007B1D0C1|nr:hypothetical protein [Labrenzia sp. OB1]KZM48263.1 hypothetical protein OA90_21125 [Labrenzia sp. OB1]
MKELDGAILNAALEIYSRDQNLTLDQRLDEIIERSKKYSCYITITSIVCSGLFGTSDPYGLNTQQAEMFIYDAERVIQKAHLQHIMRKSQEH